MRRLFAFCTVLAQVTTLVVTMAVATPQQVGAQAAPSHSFKSFAANTSREVFGYALSGSLSSPDWGYTSWNFNLLSTVAYFAIHINANGVIVADSDWQIWNSSTVSGFISTAHSHGVRVLMTVDLQDFSPGTPTMCSGLVNRDTTVLQAVNAMRNRGVDGISIDYEGLNGTCPNGQTARSMMSDFVRLMRGNLGTGMYLSVATYGSAASDPIGFFDVAAMAPYVDSFFVMAYDLEYSNYYRPPLNCSSFCLAPTAALTSYYWNDADVLSQYLGVVSASQVILGVPYYGRKACVAGTGPNAYTTSSTVAETYLDFVSEASDPAVLSGSYASHRDVYDAQGMERWDTWYNTALGCNRELYIDDSVSLSRKYDLVNSNAIRGVGLWALNYGGSSPELWSAISGHFSICTGVSTTATPAAPISAGNVVTINAAASGCTSPLYQFWVSPLGGSWTLAQPYSTSPNFRWNTSGLISATYHISVWVRAASSTNAYDSFSAFEYDVAPACPSVTTSVAPSSAPVGNIVTVNASATCSNALYAFFVRTPDGAWALGQSYTSSAIFRWNTSGYPAGSYRISAWVRGVASPNGYDSFSAFDYTLTPSCTSVSTSTVPYLAATAGNMITVSAAATCPSPLYQFWVLPPGGSWTMLQAYSTSATLRWNSAGQGGTYRFSVWARDASSPNSYDTFQAFDYSVVPVCSGVSISTVPASSASVGNTVTVTASASGCSNPLYQFWVLAPGGSWQLVQPYSTSGIYRWPTAGKARGTYRISVWVRDSSSPGYSGSAPYTYDAFNAFTYSLV